MFKFKLESVLSLKQNTEDAKKRELGLANSYKEKLEEEQSLLITQYEESCNVVRTKEHQKVDIGMMKFAGRHVSYMKKQLAAKEKEIQSAEKRVEEKRTELFEAIKEKKILENLKEIKREEYIEEAKKTEQLIVDEIVTYKYGVTERSKE